MTRYPVVQASHLAVFLRGADRAGVSAGSHLAAVGLGEGMVDDPEQFIPELPIWALAGRLRSATGRSDFGFLTQATADITDLGEFGRSISHAPTLLHALEELVREASAHSTSSDFWLHWRPDSLLVCRRGMRFGSGSWAIEQYVVMLLINLCRRACGAQWAPVRVYLHHGSPLTRDERHWLQGARIVQGSRATAIEVLAQDLNVAMPGSGIRSRAPVTPTEVSLESIRAMIMDTDPRRIPSESQAAEEVGVSPRTLRRRLREEGWSYRDLTRSIRMDHARDLLDSTRLPVTAVGEMAGYGNPSAFSRAFRQQYGVTPSRYRSLSAGSARTK
jgi:AraC-like DNA-binding protein